MILDKERATVLVWLRPEYAKFLRPDGTMVVELTRALYGCVESARLWFNDLSSFLESIGFKSNPYDPCVFSKTLSNGNRFNIAVYVDDLLLGCKNLEALKELIAQLRNKYHDVTLN